MSHEQGRIPRRRFCQISAGLMMLGCPALAEGEDPIEGRLRVAAFRCDVTPPLGYPIYPSFKPLATVEHPLSAKGIVLDDGRRRYVLAAIDWCVFSNSARRQLRLKAAQAAGTDLSRVTVQAVHQHSAPVIDTDAQKILDEIENPPPFVNVKFMDDVTARFAAAVEEAVGRLQPCDRIGIGEAEVDRVASSRRIFTEDGKLHVRFSAAAKNPALAALPEGFVDPQLKTITFASGERPLVRLHYYAVHPQSFYGDPRVSCDFVGLAREKLEAEEKVPQIYFTGCAGDVTAGKYNDGTPRARDELTERMFAAMKASAAATRLEPVGPVVWRTAPLCLPPKTAEGFTESDLRATVTSPKEPPLRRILAARRLAFQQRSQEPLDLCSLQIGRVHVLHLPGEPMVAFQLYAQQLCPNDVVAVAGYGDGCTNYICLEKAFAEGGYEPSASAVAPESESLLKAAIRRLLGLAGTE